MTGPPDELVAPDGEHPRRLARVRDRMRAGSLAALLVTACGMPLANMAATRARSPASPCTKLPEVHR